MPSYYSIKEDYIYNLNMLNEPVLEAYAGIDDDAHKTTIANNFVEKVKRIIDRILQIIDTVLMKLKNSFEKAYLTDKGFHKDIQDWKKTYKPLASVKLIVYQYDEQILNAVFNHLKGTFDEYINAYHPQQDNDANSVLNYTQDQILQDLINRSGLKNDDNITDGISFLNELKKEYRSKKVEATFKGTSVDAYIKIIDQYPVTKNLLNNELSRMKQKLNSLKSESNILANKTDAPEDAKKKMNVQLTKLFFIYNFYATFIRMYFELEVEKALLYRIVVKKLYQQ